MDDIFILAIIIQANLDFLTEIEIEGVEFTKKSINMLSASLKKNCFIESLSI